MVEKWEKGRYITYRDVEIGEGTIVWNHVNLYKCKIGKNCRIASFVEIGEKVEIGNNCKIECSAFLPKGVKLGNNVFVGPHVGFTNDVYPRALTEDFDWVPTIVKDNVSIGANSTIVCGITLNRYAMVGAGSVVTKDVSPHALVIGNPARISGYVCKCGRKLDEDMTCPKCGKLEIERE